MKVNHKRILKQVLYFGGVWMVAALLYSLMEFGLLGRLEYYPSTQNRYEFESALVYNSLISFCMGLVQGFIEVLWLRRAMRKRKLWFKIIFKSFFYLVLIVGFIFLLAWISNASRMDRDMLDPTVVESLRSFFTGFAFWSVVLYVVSTLSIALLFAEISQYFGSGMMANFLLGRYHHPRREMRIFMFLDMNGSTRLAEALGHPTYFRLLRDYYEVLSPPILQTGGSIYHYVGDEVVVSWEVDRGLEAQNCIRCYLKIGEAFRKKEAAFQKTYGQVPGFKAAFHMGEVTMGEIGEIKKDLIFTGDVLNAAARILGLCHSFKAGALVSETLALRLGDIPGYRLTPVGQNALKGKKEKIGLYRLEAQP